MRLRSSLLIAMIFCYKMMDLRLNSLSSNSNLTRGIWHSLILCWDCYDKFLGYENRNGFTV